MDIDELLALDIPTNDFVTIRSGLSHPSDERILTHKEIEVKEVPRYRAIVDPSLLEAGKGQDKLISLHNDGWTWRHVDSLYSLLKWDMTVLLDHLPLPELDKPFTNLIARIVKVDGSPYLVPRS